MSRAAMALIELTQETIDAAHGRWPGYDPNDKRRERPVSIKVFKNDLIENVFGKAHPITPIVWFGWLIVYGVYRGVTSPRVGALGTVGLFLVGWLIWTLMEYLLHRFVFHMDNTLEKNKVKAFMIHGYHHDFPDDKMRLVAPPVMSWGPAAIFAAIYYFAFGPHYWWTIMAGSATGYVAYDWIHYYTHHGRPKGGIGKWLRRYHMLHHFKDGNTRYGVSSPLWDLVFGTFRTPRTASESRAGGDQHA